jgi:GNAT superfamily N-acetyltransferase
MSPAGEEQAMAGEEAGSKGEVRPLKADDVERMIAIDQGHTKRARRRFFEKRLAAAAAHPDDFIHVGMSDGGKLVGFAFARVLHGEFGRAQDAAALDLVAVERASEHHGRGHALMQALTEAMKKRGMRLLHSETDWTDHELVRFFDSSGFTLAPRLVLERSVAEPLVEPSEEI